VRGSENFRVLPAPALGIIAPMPDHFPERTRQRVGWMCAACCVTLLVSSGGCDVTAVPVRAIDVQLLASNRSWQATYLLTNPSGETRQVPTGREVHVPLGASVRLRLASRDFVSDFTVPAYELQHFATPRLASDLYLLADRIGRYEVRGDELCGLPHTDRTRGWLVVESATAFQSWVRRRIRGEKQ
jgi:cytochrome c oxidase subunit 2